MNTKNKVIVMILSLVMLAAVAINFLTFKEVNSNVVPVSSITKMTINHTYIDYDNQQIKAPYNKDMIFISSTKPGEGDPDGHFTLVKYKNKFGFIKYKTEYNKGGVTYADNNSAITSTY